MNIKDFKWTEKRFGTRFANILKKLGGLSKDGTDGSIEYKDDQGNVTKLVTDSNFSSLLAKNGLIEVKWQELKNKRDNGKLIPGSLYRITDYNCTTTQENTRSAGHQFDIVLLALSENKLAEEGWAMMHDNIYDVTFANGSAKCYYYHYQDGTGDWHDVLVNVDTLLGFNNTSGTEEDALKPFINETNKTIDLSGGIPIEVLAESNLTYNYFQNSNLSAWKVWYCLDNDTARFAWADDSLDEGSPASIMVHNREGDIKFERDATQDIEGFYAWTNIYMITYFTNTETPSTNDVMYNEYLNPISGMSILYYTPPTQGTGIPNGRGVIYRLIDEWNNDCPYDFKNIQFVVPLTDGVVDLDEGVLTFVYTLTRFDEDSGNYVDISLSQAWGCKIGYFYNEKENKYGLPFCSCFNIAFHIEIGNACWNIFLDSCTNVSIGSNSSYIILTSISNSSFGKESMNITDLSGGFNLNYGNGGVELATKNDLN